MAGRAVAGAVALASGASALNASAPNGASQAFVHLFEWSWEDVAKECEQWLGPKGFTAVQISPPMEHIQGAAWWTRYQPVSYKLVSRSGDEAGFASMISRCKAAGVGIYADAVINHCAAGSGTGTAGSGFGNRNFPMFNQEDFHHNSGDSSHNCGVSNYQDKYNVQYCDLVGLPDLCTSCDKVQSTIAAYINHMADLGIAGFRIDASKHQDAGELGRLLSRVPSGLFRFHEVISGAGEAVKPLDYVSIGQVTEFDYPRQLGPNIINTGKLQYLNSFGEQWGFLPSADAVVFLDNHDTQRGEAQLTYKNGDLYTLASVFMLAHPYGYPKVMSSYYFSNKDQGPPSTPVHRSDGGVSCGDGQNWVCEHRIPAIGNMVAWRRAAGSGAVEAFVASSDGNAIAFCRGQAACVAINRGSSTWSVSLKLTMPGGTYHDVTKQADVSSCPTVTVNSDGSANFQVPAMGFVAIHTGAMAGGEEELVI